MAQLGFKALVFTVCLAFSAMYMAGSGLTTGTGIFSDPKMLELIDFSSVMALLNPGSSPTIITYALYPLTILWFAASFVAKLGTILFLFVPYALESLGVPTLFAVFVEFLCVIGILTLVIAVWGKVNVER